MAGGIDRLADLVDARRGAGRGLVVDDADGLDGVALVGLAVAASIVAGSTPARQSVAMNSGLMPSFAAMFFHSVAKWPVSYISTVIAGRQRVDERRFPGAGAGRGIDDHRALGLEDRLDAGEHADGRAC